jgi:hypothetical protein
MLEMNEVNNPFPGLRPFETDENNLFFGRDGQSDELLERLRRARFLAVVGTSGSGKSSLIRAGLLPALYGGLMGDAGSSWRIAIHRPGGDPIGNLADALANQDVFGTENKSEIQKTLIETTLRRSSIGLVDVARQARMQPHENLLVVVDQFEELFRFKQARNETPAGDDATAFVKLLLEAGAQSEVPIYIVLTMRSDFLGDCSQFAGLPEAINDGQYLIPRMSRDERRSAIVGPVAVGAAEITTPLVNRLLNDVGDNPDQLPILQHALMRTWDYWAAHRLNGEPLGLEHYTAIGTMSEALSRHADEAFNELPNERSRLIAEKLFKRLTEKGTDNREIRRPTPLAELCAVCEATEDEVIVVIDLFRHEGRSFLMPPAGNELRSETVIDISHESLIRNWKRLQAWVDEEAQSSRIYRRLAEAAVLHREGSEALLQDPALQIALDWLAKNKPNADWAKRYHPEFDEAVAYLEQSSSAREAAQAEKERQRNAELERERREREQAEMYAAGQARANRKLRLLMVALGLMLVLAMATAAYAFVARRQAVKQQKALAAALEIKEQAEQQRKKSDLARAQADYRSRIAEKAEQAALRDAKEKARVAESEKIKAQREEKRFQDEARRNKKAKEANDAFREAALYVQRGKYQDAKDYFSSAIEEYQDPDVNNPEAIADATVEIGNLALSVARNSFAGSGDFRLNNIMSNLTTAIGKYDEAATIYSSASVNAREKAAATNFSLAMNLMPLVLPLTNNRYGRRAASQPADASPGWNGTEGELPLLSIRPQPLLGESITAIERDPVTKLLDVSRKHLGQSLSDYKEVFEQRKNITDDSRRQAAREGIRKAAYRLGDLHLKIANWDSTNHAYKSDSDRQNAVNRETREAIHYFEELLSSYDAVGVDQARLLIWLGGLHLSLSHDGENKPHAQAAENYFNRALAAYEEVEGNYSTKADMLASLGDVLKDNEQLLPAAEFYGRARQAYIAQNNTAKVADMAYNVGQIYQRRRNASEALSRYDEALHLYQSAFENGKKDIRPENIFAIGSFFKELGNPRYYLYAVPAFELAIKAAAGYEGDDIQIYQARAYSEEGSIFSLQNKPREALDAYKQALTIYEELAKAPVRVNGSKEQAASELERVRAIIKALESGLGTEGIKK